MKIKRTLEQIKSELIDAKLELDAININPNIVIEEYLWDAPQGVNKQEAEEQIINAQANVIKQRKIELLQKIADLEKEIFNFGRPNTSLLDLILDNKKYRIPKRMAELLVNGKPVSNYSLARCIKKSLSQVEYRMNYKEWHIRIRNRLRTLKKHGNLLGYDFKFIYTPIEGYQLIKTH